MLEHIRPLIRQSVSRSFTAGSTLLYQGEVPRFAHVITKGTVKVFSISTQGDEQIVMYHIAGEFFPSSWIFGKAASTLFFYEAMSDCEVAFVPRDKLIQHMQATPEGTQAMLDYFTTNYSASLIQVNALEQSKAKDKLLYILYFLCQRYGHVHSKKITIPLTLTHQNIASLVGLTRETTATEMNKLKREEVLTYNNQKYEVDIEKLLQLIGEDSLRDVKIGL